MLFKKILRYVFDRKYRFSINSLKFGMHKRMDDQEYLGKIYESVFNKAIDFEDPKTFNEKIQWLKLYDRRPEYTSMVDKYEVKRIVGNLIGEEHVIKTLGVWDCFDDIDFDSLPEKFVLKCTHDSGGLVICRDKKSFDARKAKKKISSSLKRDYFSLFREWPYKNVKPRIIAEEYMEDSETNELRDYKFFCFDGVAKIMFVASDRQKKGEETKFDFFDMDFNHLPIVNGHPNSSQIIKKPTAFNEMIAFAEVLSKGIPHVRCDFYEVNGKVFFGELTFSHFSGLVPFKPEEWDEKMGSWIKLPNQSKGGF